MSERLKILLIEDNPGDVGLIQEALYEAEAAGSAKRAFDLTCANRLSTGLEYLCHAEIDLVVLDLSLPDSQGLATVSTLCAQFPNVPSIVLTGLDDEGVALAALQEGAQDYLIKGGLDGRTLLRAIRYAVERKCAQEELQAARRGLLQQLVSAQEEERRRIARELHDQMGQHLSALSFGLKMLRNSADVASACNGRLDALLELADQIEVGIQHLAWQIRPPELDHIGLVAALSNYTEKWARHSNIPVDFLATGFGPERFSPEVETALYRVVQEALTNVLKHARASSVSVILERCPDQLLAVVEDDGCGFDAEAALSAAAPERRLGLVGMQERVRLAGGTLKVESPTGSGTTLVVRIPLHPGKAGERVQ